MPRNNCMHPNQILSTTKIWTDVAHHQDCILSPSPSQWWCTSPPTKICLCVHHHHHHIYIQDRHHHNGGTISMGCDQSLSSTGTTAHRHAHCSANARSCSIRRCLIMRDFAGKSMKLYGVWISLFCDWVFYLWGVSYDGLHALCTISILPFFVGAELCNMSNCMTVRRMLQVKLYFGAFW